jgi:hypothetical protein
MEARYNFAIPISIVKAVFEGVQSQSPLPTVLIDCQAILGVTGAPPPTEPTQPTEPGPAPTAPTYYDIEVGPAYVADLVDYYPDGWITYTSSAFYYALDLPDFYTVTSASDDEFLMTGLDVFCTYDNADDPYFIAVPLVLLYIGTPGYESFHAFKQRMWETYEWDGYVMDTSYVIEDIYTSQPNLEFDAYWFNAGADSQFANLSKSIYFVRDRNITDAYYCLDFTFNNQVDMDTFNAVTIPLMIQILWAFGTQA